MAIHYNIYVNDSADGPVDYSTPIASGVTALFWDSGTLAVSTDTTFAVRAFDTVTGYEEQGVQARVRVVLDAAGSDITDRPSKPVGLTVVPMAGGTARVHWLYPPGLPGLPPTGFHVYLNAVLVATVPPNLNTFNPYSASLSGLADGVTYTVTVSAFNAVADGPLATALVTGMASGPDPVINLTATVIS